MPRLAHLDWILGVGPERLSRLYRHPEPAKTARSALEHMNAVGSLFQGEL